MRLAPFHGPSPKTPYRRKNIAKISYTSRVIANFVPNFVAMATGFNGGQLALQIIWRLCEGEGKERVKKGKGKEKGKI